MYEACGFEVTGEEGGNAHMARGPLLDQELRRLIDTCVQRRDRRLPKRARLLYGAAAASALGAGAAVAGAAAGTEASIAAGAYGCATGFAATGVASAVAAPAVAVASVLVVASAVVRFRSSRR